MAQALLGPRLEEVVAVSSGAASLCASPVPEAASEGEQPCRGAAADPALLEEPEEPSSPAEDDVGMGDRGAESEHPLLPDPEGGGGAGGPGTPPGCAGEEEEDAECPVCTEPYDARERGRVALNCGHLLCRRCLGSILEAGPEADAGRARCPLCRQKTPVLEWEIRRLQDEMLQMLLLPPPGAPPDPDPRPAAAAFPPGPPPPRRPGCWGGLEHRFQLRLRTTRLVGLLPCLRYPARLARALAALERRCRWGYRLALLALLAAEALSLLLLFLPAALLLLVFLALDQR